MTSIQGTKRQWQLIDEDEEMINGDVSFKKKKDQKENHASEVGVASLEWPQFDQ